MKTAEEFMKEIEGSKELQKALDTVNDREALDGFLKAHGCGATAESFLSALKGSNAAEEGDAEGEITDDALEEVVGGISILPAFSSLFSRFLQEFNKYKE